MRPLSTSRSGIRPPGHPAVDKIAINHLLVAAPGLVPHIEFFSVHMPGWVAEETAPDFARVTVLRDPVARTVSHLRHIARSVGYDSLDEVLAEDRWRTRLADYLTRTFATSATDFHAERAGFRAALRAPEGGNAPPVDPAAEAALRSEVEASLFTAAVTTRVMTEADLDAAMARLASFDIVGTTEDLDRVRQQAATLLGRPMPAIEPVNRAPDDLRASPALVAEVEAITTLDRRLYEQLRGR